jgi:hypothetical protein
MTVRQLIEELSVLPPDQMVSADVWTSWDMVGWVSGAVANGLDLQGVAVVHPPEQWTIQYLAGLGIDLGNSLVAISALGCVIHGDWGANGDHYMEAMSKSLEDEFYNEALDIALSKCPRSVPLVQGTEYDLGSLELFGWFVGEGDTDSNLTLESFFNQDGLYAGPTANGTEPIVLASRGAQ